MRKKYLFNLGIVATLGPASNRIKTLQKMRHYGFNIARLNFSHGKIADHIKNIKRIRKLNAGSTNKIKIMQDLEGFRIRIGELKKPIFLAGGMQFYLCKGFKQSGNSKIPFDYNGAFDGLKKGSLVYIDDGKIILSVKHIGSDSIKVKVVADGYLKSRKGINIPDLNLKFGSLTEKGKRDVEVAVSEKLDFVAQSFVKNANDIITLRKIVNPRHKKCRIIAKIENKQALINIDKIISASDGIMVARGDLGVSTPIYKVPFVQKEIIKKCLRAKKPVIVATQMLESMVDELIPTRAEATDVATAILEGTSGILLSAETAVGKHPEKVIEMARLIIREAGIYRRSSRYSKRKLNF